MGSRQGRPGRSRNTVHVTACAAKRCGQLDEGAVSDLRVVRVQAPPEKPGAGIRVRTVLGRSAPHDASVEPAGRRDESRAAGAGQQYVGRQGWSPAWRSDARSRWSCRNRIETPRVTAAWRSHTGTERVRESGRNDGAHSQSTKSCRANKSIGGGQRVSGVAGTPRSSRFRARTAMATARNEDTDA